MKLWVTVVAVVSRGFGSVMMAAHKIERAIIITHIFKESRNPLFVRATANRRTANLKALVNLFYSARSLIVKLKILLLERCRPEGVF